MPKPSSQPITERLTHTLDAKSVVLGRLATEAATLLRGKHKPNFELNKDCGDYVEIIHAKDITLTGNKLQTKRYIRHTGYPGGLRETRLADLMEKSPEYVVRHAIAGMLPKNRLRAGWMRRLKIYAREK